MLKISIITVVYNSVNTIEDAICSVYNQTYKNVEYIVIDGASTDGTLDIIKNNSHNITQFISEKDNLIIKVARISRIKNQLLFLIPP